MTHVSKRVLEEAAELLSALANNVVDCSIVQVLPTFGLSTTDEVVKLALKAWFVAARVTNAETINIQLAEAEALLRSGWTPSKREERKR